jgi:hypothetical protein
VGLNLRSPQRGHTHTQEPRLGCMNEVQRTLEGAHGVARPRGDGLKNGKQQKHEKLVRVRGKFCTKRGQADVLR